MNYDRLAAQLEIDEAKRPRIYLDTVGKWTGGIGRNLSDRPFSEDEIALMLKNDIAIVQADLDREFPWWRSLTDARQNALANMCFNLGIFRLRGFKKALAMLEAHRYDAAAKEFMDSKWAVQVGDRAKRVTQMIRTGEFPK